MVKIRNYLNTLLEIRNIYHHENRAQMLNLANMLKHNLLDIEYFHSDQLSHKIYAYTSNILFSP